MCPGPSTHIKFRTATPTAWLIKSTRFKREDTFGGAPATPGAQIEGGRNPITARAFAVRQHPPWVELEPAWPSRGEPLPEAMAQGAKVRAAKALLPSRSASLGCATRIRHQPPWAGLEPARLSKESSFRRPWHREGLRTQERGSRGEEHLHRTRICCASPTAMGGTRTRTALLRRAPSTGHGATRGHAPQGRRWGGEERSYRGHFLIAKHYGGATRRKQSKPTLSNRNETSTLISRC